MSGVFTVRSSAWCSLYEPRVRVRVVALADGSDAMSLKTMNSVSSL